MVEPVREIEKSENRLILFWIVLIVVVLVLVFAVPELIRPLYGNPEQWQNFSQMVEV